MLPIGDGFGCFSVVFLVLLLGTRSPLCSTVLTASVYLFLLMFRYQPVPVSRTRQVLRPGRRVAGIGISVIAHRGGAHDAPENTLAAIRKASENGATGVELDLEFTADGVAILMHDTTVDRTTNGTGPLSQLTYTDILKLDAAAKHRLWNIYHGEKVPTLEEAIEESLRNQLTIYFDVKGHADEAAAALKKMYLKYPTLYNSSIVCSFEPKVIYKMRQADPSVVTALTHRPWSLSHLGDGTPASTPSRSTTGSCCWTSCWTGVTTACCGTCVGSLPSSCRRITSPQSMCVSGNPEELKLWAGRSITWQKRNITRMSWGAATSQTVCWKTVSPITDQGGDPRLQPTRHSDTTHINSVDHVASHQNPVFCCILIDFFFWFHFLNISYQFGQCNVQCYYHFIWLNAVIGFCSR